MFIYIFADICYGKLSSSMFQKTLILFSNVAFFFYLDIQFISIFLSRRVVHCTSFFSWSWCSLYLLELVYNLYVRPSSLLAGVQSLSLWAVVQRTSLRAVVQSSSWSWCTVFISFELVYSLHLLELVYSPHLFELVYCLHLLEFA